MSDTETRRDVTHLINLFRSEGFDSPIAAIEQVTYLIFLKRIEGPLKKTAKRSTKSQIAQCSWTRLMRLDAGQRAEEVRWALQYILTKEPELVPFPFDEAAEVSLAIRAALLDKLMTFVDKLPLGDDNAGQTYEMILTWLHRDGRSGMVVTPVEVSNALIKMADLRPNEAVCDPAAGTGGTLVEVRQTLDVPLKLVGVEIDPVMARVAAMNLWLHGEKTPSVKIADALEADIRASEPFDVVICHPPMGRALGKKTRSGPSQLDAMFLEKTLELLKPGGRGVLVVPNSTLFDSQRALQQLRELLVEENCVHAVVGLPSSIFKPVSSFKASILLFSRGGTTNTVYFYDAEYSDSADDEEELVPHALLAHVAGFPTAVSPRKAQAIWEADRREIASSNYVLAPARYRPREEPIASNEDPFEIITRLLILETEIQSQLKGMPQELRDILNER